MRPWFTAVMAAVLLAACARQTDLDAANAKLAAANAALETANANLATATQAVDDLKAQLAAAQTQGNQPEAPAAMKPQLPLAWIVRKAFSGPGLVVVLSTTAKESLEVQATVRKASGSVKEVELHLSPSAPTNLDSSRGAVIDSGDVITFSSSNYSPTTITAR